MQTLHDTLIYFTESRKSQEKNLKNQLIIFSSILTALYDCHHMFLLAVQETQYFAFLNLIVNKLKSLY